MKKELYLIVLLFVISQSIKVTAQLDCSNAILMAINKTTHGNTSNSKNNNSVYNNDNFWQSTGPENVYKLVWQGGDASFKLSNKTAALDLIILGACDPKRYLTGGAKTGTNDFILNTNLPAGTYYIVIDGWELAQGSFDLTVSKLRQAITVSSRNFYLLPNDSTLYELKGSTSKVLLSGVESIGNYFGYVTNPVTGEGKQESVLAVKRYGHALPKVFLNENFNTDYLKQKLSCPQKNLTLYGEQVFDGNKEILTGCDILRCENGYTFSHQQDGKIKLLNADGNTWLDIKQIITISNRSYYIKQSDNSVWFLNGNRVVMIGSNAKLLQDNDNDLIKIDIQGNYQRWNGSIWNNLTPKYIGVSPDITNEAFWSFIQAKYLLERSDIQTSHKMGLTFDNNDQLIMELIPAIGNCDRFLWRTVDAGAGKRILINKAKGDSAPLMMSASGIPTFEAGQGEKEWEIKLSDVNQYGTNAFHLTGANDTKALTYNFIFKSVQTGDPIAGNKSQTWLFQFNQMVKDYFLPLPTKTNLLAHYTDNPNVNVHTAADSIGTSYNKFLKGTHGVTFFATNTSSDWVLITYYFIINNMLNAVITPKPSDPRVDPNIIKTIDALKGQSLILMNKNDLNAVVPNQYFTPWLSKEKTSELRGSAAYLSLQKAILASEELTCKTGIVNRPLDNVNRRFDHGVHEFAHALQELCGYISIVDANNMCPSEVGRSSECFCFDIQTWFNSNAPAYHFPGLRAFDARRSNFMSRIFNAKNTWMPPADLRQDGYNPSSGSTVSLAAKSFSSSLCDSTTGYKVKNCVSAVNAQFQSISVSGLPSNLSNEYGLKSIYIEAVIPGKLASIQPYVDLIDPKGVQHRLFNPQSFPQFDGTKQEFKVTFSACNSGGIPNANANQPFQVNGLYRPMGDNPLNKVNATNFNLNGEWKLSLCTGAEFTLKCFKLDFGPTCPTLKNFKIVTENCQSFVQILFNDIENPFCDDQDGNFLPDYYIKMVGSQNPITTWDYANHLKLALPEGKSMIEFGTYYKNSQGVEQYSCPQLFEVNVTFRDTVKPTIQNCPANATVTLDTDGKAFYNLKHPTFSDNCGTPTSLLNISFLDGATDLGGGVLYKNLPTNPEQSVPYAIKGVGRQVFEFVISDATGNSATCTTSINTLPNPITCAFKPSIATEDGNCTNIPIRVNDISGAVRIDWMNGSQVVKTSILDTTPVKEGMTVAGTAIFGSVIDVAFDKIGNLYVCDYSFHRVLKFAPGAASGVVIAGGNGGGNRLNQLYHPISIQMDNEGVLYVSESANHRVTKWLPGATSGIIVAGGNGEGTAADKLDRPIGISVDENGNVYVVDNGNSRIQKWAQGATNGITVANNLINPYDVIVNKAGDLFVVEYQNGQVKKFPANSNPDTIGIIVAKDNQGAVSMNIDAAGYIYISNFNGHYVKKFPPHSTGTTAGVVVAGGNSPGSGAHQLNGPNGITLDANGNIFIADYYNSRVQKWAQTAGELSNTFTPIIAGIYSAEITRADQCKSVTNNVVIEECNATPKTFSSSLCDFSSGYKVKNCNSTNSAQFQSISVTGLVSNRSNDFGLKSIYIEADIPGKLADIQPSVELIDPKGVRYRLINSQSFPQFDGTKQEFKATFSVCNSGGIPNADANLPFQINGVYRPMGENPLNKVNVSNVNLNGEWKLSLCTANEFTLKCFKLDFGPTCPTLKNHKIVSENCQSFVQILFNDIDNPFCDDQDGNFLPDYYIKIVGSKDPITTWHYANHLKLALPEGKSKIEFGTYYKNSQGIEQFSCPQIFEVNAPRLDTVKPTIQNCPANSTVTLNTDGKVFYNLKHPLFSDNCGAPNSTLNIQFLDGATDLGGGVLYKNLTPNPDASVPYVIKGVGRQVFEFVTMDAAGNRNSCITTVTALPNPDTCILDSIAPFFQGEKCNQHSILYLDHADHVINFVHQDPAYVENCDVASATYTLTYKKRATDKDGNILSGPYKIEPGKFQVFYIKGIGILEIKYTVIDKKGNIGTCFSTVESRFKGACTEDVTPPTLTSCMPDSIFTINSPSDTHTINFTSPKMTDNCGIDSTRLLIQYLDGAKSIQGETYREYFHLGNLENINDLALLGSGKVVVTFYAYDFAGNVSTCKTTISTRSNYVEPCDSFNPILTSINKNCINVLQVKDTIGVYRIDWKNENKLIHIAIRNTIPATEGITVAGRTGIKEISDSTLDYPTSVALDRAGNLYVLDFDKVLKFAPGSHIGKVVAGGHGVGDKLNQFHDPTRIIVDNDGNLYVLDRLNHRVMKWIPGATSGIVVAGGNGEGDGSNQLNFPYDMALDSKGIIYVIDYLNSRIQKWAPEAVNGVTLLGGLEYNNIVYPSHILVNDVGEIFLYQSTLGEIHKFSANSTQGEEGMIVASAVGAVGDMAMDAAGNFYISDWKSHSVKKYPPISNESTIGLIVAGGNGAGSGAHQLIEPGGIAVDSNNNLYIAEIENHRVQKWSQTPGSLNNLYTPTSEGSITAEITRADGCKKTTNTIVLSEPNTLALTVITTPNTGTNNGTATATVTGGTPPYNYKWTTGDTSAVIKDLPAGVYQITVTDANECIQADSATVMHLPEEIGCWESVAAGGAFAIGKKNDGSIWSWGSDGYGELGDSTKLTRYIPKQIGTSTNWQQISTGTYHSLAIKDDGSLWAWGNNEYGQLGDGTYDTRHIPIQIGKDTNWQSIFSGFYHNFAIKKDGTLWAWGLNDYGQLGDGTSDGQNVPIQIGTANDWQSIFAGNIHSLAIKKDGTLWAWGDDNNGKLGQGFIESQLAPVQIGTATDWQSISGGGHHSFAIKKDGSLWAWGWNLDGQLGDGTNDDKHSPVQIGTHTNWQSASGGLFHSIAIKTDGAIWTWGSNLIGELGDSTFTARNRPAQIGTANDWQAVEAGAEFSIAKKSNGMLWAWGGNYTGQLGDGTRINKNTPTAITPCPERIMPIAANIFNLSRNYTIHAYPNPFTEVLNIEVNQNEPNPIEVEVIDALGRILRVDNSSLFSKKHYLQIQNLDYRGLLFVKIKSNGRYDVVKLLKN